jgi:uncharacterized protein (DUF302 family)
MKIFPLCLSLVFATGSALADKWHQPQHDGGYSVVSATSVDEAITEVIARLQDQGFEIVGVIDHAENAADAGFELPPTQLILFNDRKSARRLMRRSPTTGIDLPMKILIFEGDEGVALHYNAPGYLLDRHDMATLDPLLNRLGKALDQFGDLEDGLVSVISQQSVADTADKLEELLRSEGFFIPFVIDRQWHPGRGQMLPSTLIIFGNPAIGTRLMQNSRSIGLDLPQKMLIWEDRNGTVRITYNDPLFLAQRHGLDVRGEGGLDALLNNIANALADFARQGAMP